MCPTAGELGERGLIRALRERLPGLSGIGDDSAVLSRISCPVVTTDSFFEGTHFHRWWAPPEILGRRLMEATLSDIAAMGARARWVLSAVSIEPDLELEWLLGFYRGLSHRGDVVLAGGETVRGDRFGITLTAIGEGEPEATLLRRGSLRPGDLLWVGGTLGRALDAPEILESAGGMSGDPLLPSRGEMEDDEVIRMRDFLCPTAQLELARRLRGMGARCAIDISDGLLSETWHLCRESGVDAVLELDASMFYPSVRDRPLEASASGEDFVLLVGSPPELDLSASGCTRVGRAGNGAGDVSVLLEGKEVSTVSIGYDHMEV